MNVFQEIKEFFTVKSVGESIIKEISMSTSTVTPGWKTSEFWLNIAAQAATLFAAVKGFIPTNIASIISISGVAVYTVARTVLKAVSDIKAAKAGQTTVTTTAPVTSVSTSS
jgi:hypothetical protein